MVQIAIIALSIDQWKSLDGLECWVNETSDDASRIQIMPAGIQGEQDVVVGWRLWYIITAFCFIVSSLMHLYMFLTMVRHGKSDKTRKVMQGCLPFLMILIVLIFIWTVGIGSFVRFNRRGKIASEDILSDAGKFMETLLIIFYAIFGLFCCLPCLFGCIFAIGFGEGMRKAL